MCQARGFFRSFFFFLAALEAPNTTNRAVLRFRGIPWKVSAEFRGIPWKLRGGQTEPPRRRLDSEMQPFATSRKLLLDHHPTLSCKTQSGASRAAAHFPNPIPAQALPCTDWQGCLRTHVPHSPALSPSLCPSSRKTLCLSSSPTLRLYICRSLSLSKQRSPTFSGSLPSSYSCSVW